MILFKDVLGISMFLEKERKKGHLVGFVPTMGALHQGHIALIEKARENCGLTVCSIFVNPTQFNDPADFAKYPITLEKDLKMLSDAGTDIVFIPGVSDIYPPGNGGQTHYTLGTLETVLEGKYRPGHFQGVCQVVHRLLDIVKPEILFMGQKDYQQCMVVRHLIDSYQIPTKLETCPTVREPSGLAMSSRNMRLSETGKTNAAEIYQTLQFINAHLQPGPLASIKDIAKQRLLNVGFKIDYLEICHQFDLRSLEYWDGQVPIVVLVAAFLGDVRLIDNMVPGKLVRVN